jgi:hypothetical protein
LLLTSDLTLLALVHTYYVSKVYGSMPSMEDKWRTITTVDGLMVVIL